jgi:hypothetical protein
MYLAVCCAAATAFGITQLVFAFQTPAMLVPLFPLTVRVLEAVGAVCLAHVG